MTAMAKISQNIDDAITLHMRRMGWTQSDFASRVQLSEAQFSRKRRGDAEWKVSELFKVSDLTGKSVSELLDV